MKNKTLLSSTLALVLLGLSYIPQLVTPSTAYAGYCAGLGCPRQDGSTCAVAWTPQDGYIRCSGKPITITPC